MEIALVILAVCFILYAVFTTAAIGRVERKIKSLNEHCYNLDRKIITNYTSLDNQLSTQAKSITSNIHLTEKIHKDLTTYKQDMFTRLDKCKSAIKDLHNDLQELDYDLIQNISDLHVYLGVDYTEGEPPKLIKIKK